MRTRTFLILVLILLILGGGGYFLWKTMNPASTTPGTGPEPGAQGTLTQPGQPVPVNESGAYYSVSAQYPASTPLKGSLGNAADTNAVAVLRGFVNTTVQNFKSEGDLVNPTSEEIAAMGGNKETLGLAYKTYTGPRTVTYVYTVTADTGGAHSNAYYQTFTFDTSTGAQLALGDLFQGTAYLSKLSTLAAASLSQTLGDSSDPDTIAAGTTPDPKNFKSFALSGSNLILFFPPYQVASYAAGPQAAIIPLSQLSSIIKSEYGAQ